MLHNKNEMHQLRIKDLTLRLQKEEESGKLLKKEIKRLNNENQANKESIKQLV